MNDLSSASIPQEPSDSLNDLLESLDGYILTLARRSIPRMLCAPSTLDMEIDELAQKTRIKLWQACKKERIVNIKAYTRSIVYHEAINMVRVYKPTLPLPLNEDGELAVGNALTSPSEDVKDPAQQIEQNESYQESLAAAADLLRKLPFRQRDALLCELAARTTPQNFSPLLSLLAQRGLRPSLPFLPKDKRGASRHRALLSIAYKRLRNLQLNETLALHGVTI